jgi:hypothetical protein
MRTEIPSNPHHKERTWRDIVFEAARVLRMGGTDAIGVAAMAASYFRCMDKLMAQANMEILNERYAWILSTPTSFPDVEISLRRVAPGRHSRVTYSRCHRRAANVLPSELQD